MNETIEIYLNSETAKRRGDTSDCFFSIPIIQLDEEKETAYVSLKNAVVPYSWYNVNSSNNLLFITVGVNDYTLTITPANYNVNTLAVELVKLFELGNMSFSVTYHSKTGKYDFKHAGEDFVFKKESTCFELLGLTDQDHYSMAQIGGKLIQSNASCNLFTVRQLLLCSDNFILSNISSASLSSKNIISCIPVSGNPGSIIHYQNDALHKIHHTQNLASLHIQIKNDINEIVNLNGVHWSCTLAIHIITNPPIDVKKKTIK